MSELQKQLYKIGINKIKALNLFCSLGKSHKKVEIFMKPFIGQRKIIM